MRFSLPGADNGNGGRTAILVGLGESHRESQVSALGGRGGFFVRNGMNEDRGRGIEAVSRREKQCEKNKKAPGAFLNALDPPPRDGARFAAHVFSSKEHMQAADIPTSGGACSAVDSYGRAIA